MSGRLVILPKKSYCPWNPRNVQRVLRDEKAHVKAKEQEAAKEGSVEALRRETALNDKKALKHVNLFLQEENENELEKSQQEIRSSANLHPIHALEKSRAKAVTQCCKDENLKREIDPMKEFFFKKKDKRFFKVERQSLSAQKDELRSNEEFSWRKTLSQYSRKASSRDSSASKAASLDGSDEPLRRRKTHKRNRRQDKQEDLQKKGRLETLELRLRRARREEEERQRQSRLIKRLQN